MPAVALADHDHDRDDRDDRRSDWRRSDHIHGAYCNHPRTPPAPAPRAENGRYELRTVSQWVEGYNQQTWVPEQCQSRGRGWRSRTVCRPGYYAQTWVPGHYENVDQWVWVSLPPPPPRYEQPRYERVPAGWEVRIGGRL